MTRAGIRDCAVADVENFECLLAELTGLSRQLSRIVATAVNDVFDRLGGVGISDETVRSRFYGRVNQKLMANRDVLRDLYAFAAARRLTFNYPTKKAIAWAVDTSNAELFGTLVRRECGGSSTLADGLMSRFRPIPQAATRDLIVAEARKPTKLRKAHDRDVALDVFEACVGPLLWSLWPAETLHGISQPSRRQERSYTGDYLQDLRAEAPDLFSRDRALVISLVCPSATDYEAQRQALVDWIADEYQRIDNYGFLALILKSDTHPTQAWELSADLTLFAERFYEYPLAKSFFRSAEVFSQTMEHVTGIVPTAARFELINEGFTYRDLFVLAGPNDGVKRLLLVFQKNRRDETPVPCPACRSSDVAGNSYPCLGVKSWECRNPLCPERSIYNRGKRYSFKSLVNQAAIEHPENAIPTESVRRWQRDVVAFLGDDDVVDMLTRHYSMAGDTVVLMDSALPSSDAPGRVIRREERGCRASSQAFWHQAAFFARYAVAGPALRRPGAELPMEDTWSVLEGDAHDLLAEIPDGSFDRAVTSPPYFNARDYAQWPNLYCYLYDMHRINGQVMRTLKPGALYVYNIFDYFDNERTIVFSDMGRKRIALSAVMVDLFRRIGFEFMGSAVWDKGDIHGKRGFNAGNFSPFYQAPFNCWEHVLVLRKPLVSRGQGDVTRYLNQILRIPPVIKMIRGENKYGHTAPFPVQLPEAMLGGLQPNDLVLDPFGGSGTTARAAINLGLRALLVERDPAYCELSRRLLEMHEQDALAAQETLW
jgi:DNA modification methylase